VDRDRVARKLLLFITSYQIYKYSIIVCVSITSLCSINHNERQIMEMIYFGDQSPSAPLITPMLLLQFLHSTVLVLENDN